ncbi:MAG: hypothetical protein WC732_08130 [Candidatus Omnitrophota bacterium]
MKNNSRELSISELVQQLENKILEPGSLDKTVLQKCAVLFKNRGYSNEDISEILKVSSRTIDRYIENVRSETSLMVGINFQKELLGEILNHLKLRYQRLLRLSYSDKLSDFEKARTVCLCHQIEMDGVALLSRLGYLSREQGLGSINHAEEEAEESDKQLQEMIREQAGKLSMQQRNSIDELLRTIEVEREARVRKMAISFFEENENQDRGVSLFCSVTVLNN